MSTDIHSNPPTHHLDEAAREIGRDTANTAGDMYDTFSSKVGQGVQVTKDAAQRATVTAKDLYQSASAKAEDALVTSKEYAHQNPFPVALGTLITGLALGYLIGMAQRPEPTFRQRLFS